MRQNKKAGKDWDKKKNNEIKVFIYEPDESGNTEGSQQVEAHKIQGILKRMELGGKEMNKF